MYPDLSDIERTLVAATFAMGRSITLDGDLQTRPPTNLVEEHDSTLATRVDLLDMFHDFAPVEGQVTFFERLERFARLEEGEYEVLVPETEIQTPMMRFETEPTPVRLVHTRTHHKVASSDLEKLYLQDADKRYVFDFEGNFLSKIVNLEFFDDTVSTSYSEFRISIPELACWQEIREEFAEFHDKHLAPFRKEQEAFIKNYEGPRRGIVNLVRNEITKFLDSHGELFSRYLAFRQQPDLIRGKAVRHFIETYEEMLGPRPMILHFPPIIVGVDSQGYCMKMQNFAPETPISQSMWRRGSSRREVEPFNDVFHKEFRENLTKEPKQNTPYEDKAYKILLESYRLVEEGFATAAITRAATAFEVVMRGFLYERNAIQDEDDPDISMRNMLNGLFKRAIRNDPDAKQRKFDKRIKGRILGVRGMREAGPSIQRIRNMRTHQGLPKEPSGEYAVALIACDTYAEAMKYVLSQGWHSSDTVTLASETLTWLIPAIKGKIPHSNLDLVRDAHLRALPRALSYINQRELEFLRSITHEDSRSYDLLHSYK
ncbi:MAG: hypothetical protein ACE5FT_06445 [Candidatus Nanoarchaeia archaeon]